MVKREPPTGIVDCDASHSLPPVQEATPRRDGLDLNGAAGCVPASPGRLRRKFSPATIISEEGGVSSEL
ncbi:hypothetical protein JNB11_08755 [Kocuria palustris]|nr:hypothetical protein [Kocuria palustris]